MWPRVPPLKGSSDPASTTPPVRGSGADWTVGRAGMPDGLEAGTAVVGAVVEVAAAVAVGAVAEAAGDTEVRPPAGVAAGPGRASGGRPVGRRGATGAATRGPAGAHGPESTPAGSRLPPAAPIMTAPRGSGPPPSDNPYENREVPWANAPVIGGSVAIGEAEVEGISPSTPSPKSGGSASRVRNDMATCREAFGGICSLCLQLPSEVSQCERIDEMNLSHNRPGAVFNRY